MRSHFVSRSKWDTKHGQVQIIHTRSFSDDQYLISKAVLGAPLFTENVDRYTAEKYDVSAIGRIFILNFFFRLIWKTWTIILRLMESQKMKNSPRTFFTLPAKCKIFCSKIIRKSTFQRIQTFFNSGTKTAIFCAGISSVKITQNLKTKNNLIRPKKSFG